MIFRLRVGDLGRTGNDDDKSTKWALYKANGWKTLHDIFESLHSQKLMPKIDLSWADTDTIQIFTTSTKKELPNDDALMEVSSDLTQAPIYSD